MGKRNEYALYNGDEFVDIGTKEELAKALNVKPETISFYASPTYRKRFEKSPSGRLIAIRLDDEEETNSQLND